MDWVVKVAEGAQLFIDGLSPKTSRQLNRSIVQMKKDPFHGDVKPLQGKEWKGYYRKRTGDYRIIFFPNHEKRTVHVAWVVLRSEKTYR